jgi:hypothetical protein
MLPLLVRALLPSALNANKLAFLFPVYRIHTAAVAPIFAIERLNRCESGIFLLANYPRGNIFA